MFLRNIKKRLWALELEMIGSQLTLNSVMDQIANIAKTIEKIAPIVSNCDYLNEVIESIETSKDDARKQSIERCLKIIEEEN
jgi:hypothetical protein